MFMRAVFASAMLIGVAATAQAETRIIYPPHSYQQPLNLCDYLLGVSDGCSRHYSYGYHYRHHDMGYYAATAVTGEAQAKMAKIVVIVSPPLSE